jgi:CelD/BcsL family acetyltransferase involved in cellulose biosynthesis
VRVQRFDNLNELLPYRDAWNALAGGVVFRGWTWLAAWWRHYGEGHSERSLKVFAAFRDASNDPDGLLAILPAYAESTWTQGRVLRLLGDGEVCSDHLGVLVKGLDQRDAMTAIAREIAGDQSWDLVEFSAIDESDAASQQLLEELAKCDFMVNRTPADRCWTIDLPPTWDDFLALQSKSHRKQVRQLERRVLAAPQAEWRLVTSPNEFGDAWSTLVDLHQRRRQSLGEPGCFASAAWASFHWDVAQQLLSQGALRLSTLRLDGQPIAAEYHFAGRDATWAYQGGVDPQRLADEPGQLSTICSIRRAIDEGHGRFDFLRGDEPYKAHWRAAPHQTYRLTAAPNRFASRLRLGAYNAAKNLRSATRQLTGLFS